MARHTLTIALTHEEIARSWLVEYYRRQGSPPMRTMLALGLALVGAAMVRRTPTTMAWIALAWGCFLLLRPIAFAAWLRWSPKERPAFVVTIDEQGVKIAGPKGAHLFPWAQVTAWGLGSDYLWYEIRRGSRAIIPFRVMDDRASLEATFRAYVEPRQSRPGAS